MDCAELSDLEEGEILEYESLSPSDTWSDDNEIKSRPYELLQKENKNGSFRIKETKVNDLYLIGKRKKDDMHNTLKNKLNLNGKLELTQSNISMVDLESISSEEDCKSDRGEKYFSEENKYCKSNNEEKKIKRKHSSHFYGTVEDIMSEIGETICRKSRCNYKKRKSKGLRCNLYKYSDNSYDLWRNKIFSSHLKHKKHKRKISFNDSDAELTTEKRKKRRKKGEVHYEEDERRTKRKQVNDFDEMRKNLLEKLQKKKAEEELKEKIHESTLKVENSDIQEVGMLIDCTNYVDISPDLMPENSANKDWVTKEKNGEDELDLIKLRLIALASNKKRKDGKDILKAKKLEVVSEKNNSSNNSNSINNNNNNNSNSNYNNSSSCRMDTDFDRNELLLRAEALKTALLKKHQKRLNRMKINKLNGVEGSDDNNVVNVSSSLAEENTKEVNLEKDIGNLDSDAFKENVEKKSESVVKGDCSDVSSVHALDLKMKINEISESAVISSASSKNLHLKIKSKRKKKKSGLVSAVSLREKSENNEALEEDDRTLRSQLLSDLMKKKSQKDFEKKPVLTDSVHMLTNKHPFSIMNCATARENMKPLTTLKGNLLKKINNTPKKTKPKLTPLIPNPEIQRIIVHLGSEESSDEDEISSQPHYGSRKKNQSLILREQEKKVEESDFKSAELCQQENKVIQAAYEKSVELLLNQARRKIEGQNRTTEDSALTTPEAVYKHLPPSQRLEYIKLKQKIAEREKLRNERKEYSSNSVFASIGSQPLKITMKKKESIQGVSQKLINFTKKVNHKSTNSPSNIRSADNINCCLSESEVVSHLPSNAKVVHGFVTLNGLETKGSSQFLVNNKIDKNFSKVYEKNFKQCIVQSEKEERSSIPSQRNTLLLPSSQALLTKLKLLLKKIKIEKTIEENYEKEISKLKSQLSLFEKKKGEQRFKIKKLGEESIKTYKAIQCILAKFNEKSVPEKIIIGEKSDFEEKKIREKKVKEEKDDEDLIMPKEPDKDVKKGETKLDNELDNDDKINEAVANGTSSSVCLQEYKSPLQVFNKASDCSEKVDPNVMMCQFDLLGICKDQECAYQHLRAS